VFDSNVAYLASKAQTRPYSHVQKYSSLHVSRIRLVMHFTYVPCVPCHMRHPARHLSFDNTNIISLGVFIAKLLNTQFAHHTSHFLHLRSSKPSLRYVLKICPSLPNIFLPHAASFIRKYCILLFYILF
jgi:hypothetical protein